MLKCLAFAGAMTAGSTAVAQDKVIIIGIGGQTGVYFVVDQSICRFVNGDKADHTPKVPGPPSTQVTWT